MSDPRRVRLMLTCLCDAFYGDVGRATVQVLEKAGCVVEFDDRQTCCGQPAFNSGDWLSARRVAEHTSTIFAGDVPVVTPSGSCAAMVRHGYPQLLPQAGLTPSFKVYELSEFLTDVVGLTSWPATPYPRKIAFHRACHGRLIGIGDRTERLLATIPGLDLQPVPDCEQCCGFGGSFTVKEPHLSASIGEAKLDTLAATHADEIVSGDMGCLMHLSGLADKLGRPVRTRHYAQILAEVAL